MEITDQDLEDFITDQDLEDFIADTMGKPWPEGPFIPVDSEPPF